MSTQYHFDNMILTSREALKNAVENDWYKKYNQYMIQEFFYIGRQFELNGITYEVLSNYARESHVEGWLYLKAIGENSYKSWISPKKVLFEEPSLKKELDEGLERANIFLEINENHVQMQLF
ncbi:hypothetical protein OCD65_23380 [Bacillus paranthracis]|uniref:hypothetical protein n=1 Tax=Bacillus paranthracis TaxID=2026186 RepID=UPI0021D04AD9|nr:hypothetical protein [Bacillus paranthracis]MCU5019629.1 hypothetical protein [Bacillus paranthracis]